MLTNPLDNIRIASPCRSDWNEMYGDDRKRFCSECRMNVYNLSGMSRSDAESLLVNSEGRLCVRFFRRGDGTVLTKDCPVGWRAIKKRLSRTATAVASLILGCVTGLLGIRATESLISMMPTGDVPPVETERRPTVYVLGGYEGEYEAFPIAGKVAIPVDVGSDVAGVDAIHKVEDLKVRAPIR